MLDADRRELLRCLWYALTTGIVVSAILLLLVLAFAPAPLAAAPEAAHEGEAIPLQVVKGPADVERGSLLLQLASGGMLLDAPQLETGVDISVSGMLLRARVRQRFHNPAGDWVQGIYVFPLPDDAAVDHLRLVVGERVIEGEILEKTQAERVYNEAKKSGRKAALLRQERPNIFTTAVANIPPGGDVEVEIEFQQPLAWDNGGFSMRFPLVVGPRYIPGRPVSGETTGFAASGWSANTDQVPDAARVTPPVAAPDSGRDNPVTIRVDLDAGMPLAQIDAPYHAVTVAEVEAGRYRVGLAAGPIDADRDFVLRWRPAVGPAPRAALFRQRHDGHDYGLLMLVPPAAEQLAESPARELILVVDTSGSMHGESMAQAREAVVSALERLQPADRFNVIRFNHQTGSLYPTAMPATPERVRQAVGWVGGLRANGGTEMRPALAAALNGREHQGRLRQVVFVTDGAVGNEAALFRLVNERLGDSRLFTVGIGSAPNSYLMTRLAEHGNGSFVYIGNPDEVQLRMAELLRKLEHPALTDLAVDFGGNAVDITPARPGDLYAGEPLVIALRAAQLPRELTVDGRLGGQPWRQTLDLSGGADRPGVHVLWARRRIRELMGELASGRPADEVRPEVVALALSHHLVSRYTSLVAVDRTPARPPTATLEDRPLPTLMPAGWSTSHVFGTLPQTATPALLHLLLGFGALLTGTLLSWRRSRPSA